jgi:molybdate transport system substrate-binding protein
MTRFLEALPIRLPGRFRSAVTGLPKRIAIIVAVIVAGIIGLPVQRAHAEDLMVFAAMTLQGALDDAAGAYQHQSGNNVIVSYGPSAALVKQIDNGAPADIFISADSDWMDAAQARGLIHDSTRVDLLSSQLVLIAPRNSSVSAAIKAGFPIEQMLGNGRLVMCDPMMMPAGRYGRAALQNLGVWQAVQDRVANADNVRAALAFVSRGEAPLGVVFDTDAALDKGVKIVGVFPAESHPPIVYPAAVIASSDNPAAEEFLAFLRSAAAKSIFERNGYIFLPSLPRS